MNIKSRLLFTLSISLLTISQTAHADFRKALEAYQNRDGTTMLKEVKDAVEKKNDDGIILFLGILKQYPKTWRPTLNEAQQTELFNSLEAATAQSSLQAQYKLAVIPRKENNPPPIPKADKDRESWYEERKQEKIQEYQDEITRLEPVANQGYAPAALQLYGNYAHNLTKSKDDIENAMKWLIKAAELGNTRAAFMLGMKYLNVEDDYYGCTSYEPNLCLPKNETKGWYWMQKAGAQVNERNIMLGDFAYHMGNLYLQGVAGNKPDHSQAYLWYMLGVNNAWQSSPSIKIKEQLSKMHQTGQLKLVNPQLDLVWNDAKKQEKLLNPTKLTRLPSLFQTKIVGNVPVFSFFSFGWYGWGQTIDMYADGIVKISDDDWVEYIDNNEIIIKMDSKKVQEFIVKLQHLGINDWPLRADYDECFMDCFNLIRYVMTINENHKSRTVLMSNEGFSYSQGADKNYVLRINRVAEVLGLLNEFIPSNFPIDKLRCSLTPQGVESCKKFDSQINNILKQEGMK